MSRYLSLLGLVVIAATPLGASPLAKRTDAAPAAAINTLPSAAGQHAAAPTTQIRVAEATPGETQPTPAADTSSLTAAPDPGIADLPIPTPANAHVIAEIDARGDELLGVFKSLLAGFDTNDILAIASARMGLPTAAGPYPVVNVSLSDMLKDINHVHVLALAAPDGSGASFYENAFRAEGAHRTLWLDTGDAHLLGLGFDKPHGFALVFDQHGMVGVLRTDGYPNAASVGAIVKTFLFVSMPHAAHP